MGSLGEGTVEAALSVSGSGVIRSDAGAVFRRRVVGCDR